MPTMTLPVQLTDPDRLEIQASLTIAITAQETVEAEKREATKGFSETINGHKKTIHELNESLRTGTVLRQVEIEERHDYAAGIVFIWRLDTNECVRERAIDPDERQVKLGIDGPKVDGDKADTTDEQRLAESPEQAEAMRADRLEVERLAAEQIEDDAKTNGKPKRGFRKGLKAPTSHKTKKSAKGISVENGDTGEILYDGSVDGGDEPPPDGLSF